MRDSRLGTFGALALLFALLRQGRGARRDRRSSRGTARWRSLARRDHLALAWRSGTGTRRCRRGATAWPGRPAGRTGWRSRSALAVGAIAALVLLVVFGLAALIGLLLAAVGGRHLLQPLRRRQIGGHTGDTIGAAQQIAETLLLAGLSVGWTSILA